MTAPFVLPRAWQPTGLRGTLRSTPEDFQVEELLGFEPDDAGEHLLVRIEKRNLNTAEVAGLIARHLELPRRAVTWAGRKDRRAVTCQWFGVHWGNGAIPDLGALDGPGLTVLGTARHRRKLRPGALAGNRFRIRITDLNADASVVEQRLARIIARGVPNYFGPQRFGRGGANVAAARTALAGNIRRLRRDRRSLLLSAARSWLFNQVLASRVVDGSWEKLLPGELVVLEGSASFFSLERLDDQLEQRLACHDISPSGPLPGAQATSPREEALAVEQAALAGETELLEMLVRAGLRGARRSLRLFPRDLEWEWLDQRSILELRFVLPRGAFATAVIAELCETAEGPQA